MTLERAIADAEVAGLEIGTTAIAVVDASVAPAGTVLSQDPLPGAKVEPGTGISLVLAEAPAVQPPAQPPTGDSSGGTPSGSTGGTGDTTEPPPPPEDVTVNDISKLIAKPKVVDLGVFKIQQWTTVLEHTGADLEWTSAPITLGSGEKQIILSGDGSQGYLVAVHSWGVGDTDWKLRSIAPTKPGGEEYVVVLDAPAGLHTFMVKSMSSSVLWTLKVQEKK
jgi:hypothetical protein